MKTTTTIIGFGIMGKAIKKAINQNNKSMTVYGVDKDDKAITQVQKSNFVIIAVKPQDAKEALLQLRPLLSPKAILISIMAGYPIKKISEYSGHKKIIRMMPNIGLAVGTGIAVWKATGTTEKELATTKKFINMITENFEVKNEDMINKSTAISGSGPAYFFLLAEHLVQAGIELGFTKAEARKLVAQTLLTSAATQADTDYLELIAKVASKKGTTEAALKTFKKKNLRGVVKAAVTTAYKRAVALSKA